MQDLLREESGWAEGNPLVIAGELRVSDTSK